MRQRRWRTRRRVGRRAALLQGRRATLLLGAPPRLDTPQHKLEYGDKSRGLRLMSRRSYRPASPTLHQSSQSPLADSNSSSMSEGIGSPLSSTAVFRSGSDRGQEKVDPPDRPTRVSGSLRVVWVAHSGAELSVPQPARPAPGKTAQCSLSCRRGTREVQEEETIPAVATLQPEGRAQREGRHSK